MLYNIFYVRSFANAKPLLQHAASSGSLEVKVSGNSYPKGAKFDDPIDLANLYDEESESHYDWCSNIRTEKDPLPYAEFRYERKKFVVESYTLQMGCHDKEYCCKSLLENDTCVDCQLTGWLFQISNDQVKWETVSRVEDAKESLDCKVKRYRLNKKRITRYVRLIPLDNSSQCMQFSKFDVLGLYEFDPIADGNKNVIGRIHKQRQFWY